MATSGSRTKATRNRRKKVEQIEVTGITKQKVTEPITIQVKTLVCRKCLRRRSTQEYYRATDPILDSSGFMSVCRYCIEDMYQQYFLAFDYSIEKTIFELCKVLNVLYDEEAVKSAIKQIDSMVAKGQIPKNIFGYYRKNLVNGGFGGFTTLEDLRFRCMSSPEVSSEKLAEELSENDIEYLKKFWGENFTADDYKFLEYEFSEWKQAHKCDTKAEESLLKELCHKELEIRRAREMGNSTASLVKEKQDLMKTANVDPAKTNVAGSGKSHDTFSSFIKTIEENEPAEYYEDKKLFKDFDNLDPYFRKYVTRPLKNFITQSRDFNVEGDGEDDLDEDGDFDISGMGE